VSSSVQVKHGLIELNQRNYWDGNLPRGRFWA